MKISKKISLIFSLVFLVIFLIAVSAIGVVSNSFLKETALDSLIENNVGKADHIRTYLRSEKEVVLSFSTNAIFRDFLKQKPDSVEYSAKKKLAHHELGDAIAIGGVQIYELSLLDVDGKVVASTNRDFEGLDRSQDSYFTEGQKGAFIKELYFSDIVNKYTYSVSAPIKDQETDKLLGVIVVRMDPATLFSIAQSSSKITDTGESFLINSDKYLLTPNRFVDESFLLKKKIDTKNASDCFDPEETEHVLKEGYEDVAKVHHDHKALSDYVDYRGVDIIGTHSYIPETGWCFISKINKSEALALSYRLSGIFGIIAFFSIMIFIIISSLISKKITESILILQKGMEIVERGDLDYQVKVDSKDEIGQLAKQFNEMTLSVKQSRADVDRKVEEQTVKIVERGKELEDQQKATLNILEDVNEEKEKVGLERDKINAILHSIGDGVFVVDSNLEIILINQVALDLCGYSLEEALGKKYSAVLNFISEDTGEVKDQFIKKAISLKTIQEMANHTMLTSKAGEKMPVADSAAPLLNKEDEAIGCVVVFRDVTKEREVDRAKTEFVAVASHELRTPLTAIDGIVSMIKDGDYGPISKNIKQPLDDISLSSERLIHLVNDLLSLSRIQTGRLKYVLSEFSLKEAITETVHMLQSIAEKKSLVLSATELDKSIVQADVDKIKQLLNNLIGNSLKFTDKGSITVSTKSDKDNVVIYITDTGIGIKKEDQEKLFGQFQQLESSKGRPEGTGLGLYISKEIAQKMGGDLWIEKSEEGKGSTFAFSVPIAKSSVAEEVRKKIEKEALVNPDQKADLIKPTAKK